VTDIIRCNVSVHAAEADHCTDWWSDHSISQFVRRRGVRLSQVHVPYSSTADCTQ